MPLRALLALLVPAVLACGGDGEPASVGDPRPRSVVVITLDTTRADALGAYGQELPVTPRIDAMAAEGVLFEQAVTSSPSTLPSHATLFTGRQPYAHGVRSNTGYRLSEENLTLAEVLAGRGWATAAEIAAPVLASDRLLGQGFETYQEPKVPFVEALEVLQENFVVRFARPAEEVTEGGLGFVRGHVDAPFFLWLHYFDAHIPHDPPEPFASRFPDAYFAEVSRIDHQVGRFLDELERLGLREHTLVVLSADHGEGRGEHDEDTHAYFVYDSTIRVPLIFWGADLPRGQRVASLVRVADVAPTLLDLLGLPPLEDVQGVSLRPLLEDPGRDLELTAYGDTIEWRTSMGGDVLRYVREGRWKYIHKLEPALYDVLADPGEARNLADERPEVVERLRGRLEELLAESPEAPGDAATPVSPEEAARLRALGYAAEAGSGAAGEALDDLALAGPDPDARARDLTVFIHALTELANGNAEGAEPLYRDVWKRNPKSRYALAGLIHALLALDRDDEAAELLRKGLELDPGSVGQRLELAKLLKRRGNPQEAERLLREALEIEPCVDRARLQLSQVLRMRGLQAQRIEVLAGAPGSCPDTVISRNALAYALATVPDAALRDGPRAVRLAEAVVEETEDEHPDYLDSLAAAYAEVGDFGKALATERRALELVAGRELPPHLVEPFERHLAAFQAGEPLRVP